MSYAQWSSFAFYNVGDIVVYAGKNYQALLSNTNVKPPISTSDWVQFASAGTYIETTGGSATATITAPTCLPTSIVIATYIHAGAGGGPQYISSIVPTTGSFSITTNTNIDLNDEVNWLIVSP